MSANLRSEHVAGEDNIRLFGMQLHNPVFFATVALLAILCLYALLVPDLLHEWLTPLRGWLFHHGGALLMWIMLLTPLLCLALIVSPLGGLRIGGNRAQREFGYLPWLGLICISGIGLGMVYFSSTESLRHFAAALGGRVEQDGLRIDWAPLQGAAEDVPRAISLSFAATLYHWGLLPWTLQALMAAIIALCTRRFRLPMLPRATLYPWTPDYTWRTPGHVLDLCAVAVALLGTALVLSQATSALGNLFTRIWPVPQLTWLAAGLVLVGLALAVLAALHYGLRRALLAVAESSLLLLLLIPIALVMLLDRPATEVLQVGMREAWQYLIEFARPWARDDQPFQFGWSLVFWSWWIPWCLFSSLWLVQISRGRSLRSMLLSATLLPCAMSIGWIFSTGSLSLSQALQSGQWLQQVNSHGSALLIRPLLEHTTSRPLVIAALLLLLLLLAGVFLVASWAVTHVTAGGVERLGKRQSLFWCLLLLLLSIAAYLFMPALPISAMRTLIALLAMAISALFLLMLYGAVHSHLLR